MPPQRTIKIPPKPSALITSLRGLGYSPETALADLIDNCITAGSTSIEIDLQWRDGIPIAAILDNGRGMDEACLTEAMRLGGDDPDSLRHETDLGRFGMGLKTASLSQSRSMVVVSKVNESISAVVFDIETVASEGWIAIVPDPLPDHPYVAELLSRLSGTVVIWDSIDELSGLAGLLKEPFYLRLEEIRAHLGMVFHRFINGDARRLSISLNGRLIKAWDPFQTAHTSTTELPSERIRHAGATLSVKPYILPHRDRFANDAEYEAAGGSGGWAARQGFYVYRGKRLLVAGSWLGLGGARIWAKDEACRLARIQVDLPTGLDRDWRIDVRKSLARPPGALRARLMAIAGRCREGAREVFAFRGKGPRARDGQHSASPIWLSIQGTKGYQYRINRDHPAIIDYKKVAIGGGRGLDAIFSIIERNVPVERIWLEVSESEGVEVIPFESDEIAKLSEQLIELSKVLPETMSLTERIDMLLLNLPGDLTELRLDILHKLGGKDG